MQKEGASSELISLLNKSLAREMQVSIQYMLQHSIWNAKESTESAETMYNKQSRFIGSHSSVWLPGLTLKKVAITEMRHAEAVAERIVQLGEDPTTQPNDISIGNTLKEILAIDREQEHGAIELYEQIISVAEKEGDELTLKLFKRILSDEVKHYQIFSKFIDAI